MKLFKSFLFLTVALFGFSLIQVSAQTTAYGKNLTQGIHKQIRKEIMTLPYYGVFDAISYKFDNGVVYLSGSVVQPITKTQAGRFVKSVQGVTDVVNNIEVLPPSTFDDRIRYAVVNEFDRRGGSLYRYLQGTNPSMRIIVKNGHISLEGYVANRGDYNLANILANGIPGTFSVTNNLIIDNERAE